jgi:uncharacterized protein (TIGR02145 family)
MIKQLPVLIGLIFLIGCTKDNNDTGSNPSNIASVTICSQVWMKENLSVDRYRNGDAIPQVTDPNEWRNLTTGAWCYYNNDPAMGEIYGKLYNWAAVNDPRGLAPVGWHVPSETEWTTLSSCLGGEPVAGGKMKSTTLWVSPNTGATNSSGFTALPSGLRNSQGLFNSKGTSTYIWSSTINIPVPSKAIMRDLSTGYANLFQSASDMINGQPVRCVKD